VALATADTFDVRAPWAVSDRVSVREEAFGALAYHHVTRRLVFLKSPLLVSVVRSLERYDSAHDALCELVPTSQYERYVVALASLARAEILRGR